MSFKTDLPFSAALHLGVVGIAAAICMRQDETDPLKEPTPISISVELVEASSPTLKSTPEPKPKPEPKTEPKPEPKPEPEPEPEPEPKPESKPMPEPDPEPEPEPEPEPIPEPDPEPEKQESEQRASAKERPKIVADPVALGRIEPVYPRSARRRKHEGRVTVEAEVDEAGKTVRTEVVLSSGHRELDNAAVSAMQAADFAPATEDGISVRGTVRLTFDFRLR